MNLKRPTVFALRWCSSCVLLTACWAVWLALSVLLAVQIWIATHRELALPAFALRAIEDRLGASQVTARFGRAVFDPTGRVVIGDVQLFSPDLPTPLVTIRAVYARLDFWALLVGELRLHELRLTGVDLHVPAMLSPSGTDEAVVSDLDGVFHLARSDYSVDLCTFRVAGLAVSSRGTFHLPAAVRPRAGSLPMLDLLFQRYLNACRKLAALRPWLDALEDASLQLVLTPSEDRGAVVDADFSARSFHPAAPFRVAAGRIHAVFPLLGATPAPVQAQLETDRLEWNSQAWADRVRVDLAGTLAPDHFDFTPQTARVTAARGEALAVPFAAPCVTATLERLPHLQGSVSARIGGSAVTARGTMDIQAGEGTLELTGSLTPALLDLARNRSRLAVLKWVELSEPAAVHATVELAPGWKPVRAEADVSVRQVTAHEVHLDAAGGHVLYAGHDLRVTELLLLQGANEARGSYTMDTATRDYRFLLQGRLRPPDIAGWFKAWWPRFWGHFDFTAVPPSADVDVTGRWGAPPLTTVFCQVDAAHPAIRGVPFDRVRTILFFRANYYHVFAFDASQAGHAARGSFTLEVDHQHATYRTLDFDVFSGLVPAECARLYGPAGTALVAPYQFSEPPAVHAVGHLQGPSAPGGNHAQVNITLESPGHSVFHGLPLEGVKFAADYHDGSLDLRQTQAGFAGGTVSGQARLDGPPGARVLAFDAMLNGADLARVASAAEEFRLAGKPPAAEHPKSRFLGRATGGRLDAALTAEGRYGQPYSFHGKGYFIVTSHDLGEIHLLGLLSELLSKTLLNFTSLRLDTAHGNFKLEGNKLAFAQVKLTGPTAAIDARGDYLLDAKTLDFNAKVFPLQESGFVLTDALGALLTPLSNVLELKLTGPLEKPSWAFLFGPTNFLRALTKPPGPASGGPPLTVPVPSGTEPPKSNAPAPAPQPVKPEG